jgi:hypothetical protein
MIEPLIQMLSGLGYAVDTPGALLRGVLSGAPGERRGGREMLESWGMGKNTPGLDFGDVLGFGAEMLLDPLNLVGAGLVGKTGRAASRAMDVNDSIRRAADAALEGPIFKSPDLNAPMDDALTQSLAGSFQRLSKEQRAESLRMGAQGDETLANLIRAAQEPPDMTNYNQALEAAGGDRSQVMGMLPQGDRSILKVIGDRATEIDHPFKDQILRDAYIDEFDGMDPALRAFLATATDAGIENPNDLFRELSMYRRAKAQPLESDPLGGPFRYVDPREEGVFTPREQLTHPNFIQQPNELDLDVPRRIHVYPGEQGPGNPVSLGEMTSPTGRRWQVWDDDPVVRSAPRVPTPSQELTEALSGFEEQYDPKILEAINQLPNQQIADAASKWFSFPGGPPREDEFWFGFTPAEIASELEEAMVQSNPAARALSEVADRSGEFGERLADHWQEISLSDLMPNGWNARDAAVRAALPDLQDELRRRGYNMLQGDQLSDMHPVESATNRYRSILAQQMPEPSAAPLLMALLGYNTAMLPERTPDHYRGIR